MCADHIGIEPRYELSRLGSGEECDRHLKDVVENLRTKVKDQALADRCRKPALDYVQHGLQHFQAGDRQAQDDHDSAIALQNTLVDDLPEDERRRHIERGDHYDQGDEYRDQNSIGLGKLQDAPDNAGTELMLGDLGILRHAPHQHVHRHGFPPGLGNARRSQAMPDRRRPAALWTQHKGPAVTASGPSGVSRDQRLFAGAFLAVVFFAGAFLAADFFAGALDVLAALAVVFFAGAFLAADFFAGALDALAALAVVFFAGAFLAVVFFAAALAGAFLAGAFLAAAVVVFFAALVDAAFLTPRVAPPRPRSSTPASFKTPCTNPKERPASSAIFRMLSPAAYRLAYWEASVVRCAPVMREPLANALATAPPLS